MSAHRATVTLPGDAGQVLVVIDGVEATAALRLDPDDVWVPIELTGGTIEFTPGHPGPFTENWHLGHWWAAFCLITIVSCVAWLLVGR